MRADERKQSSRDRISRCTVARGSQAQSERGHSRAERCVARGRAKRVGEPLARLCLRPRDAWSRRGQTHGTECVGTCRRVAHASGRAQHQPVADWRETLGRERVRSRGAVVLPHAFERTREIDESRGALALIFRAAERGGGLCECNGVRAALERRARQKLASVAVELIIDPRRVRQQLVDFGPTAPAGRCMSGEQQSGRRSLRRIAQFRRDELRRAPWMPTVDQRLRVTQHVVSTDRAREVARHFDAHVAGRVRLVRPAASHECRGDSDQDTER